MQVSLLPQYNRNLTFSAKNSPIDEQKALRASNSSDKKNKYENPINSGFEYLTAVKATLLAGLAFTARLAFHVVEYGDFNMFDIFKTKPNMTQQQRMLEEFGLAQKKVAKSSMSPALKVTLLATSFVALSTGLYCAFALPKNLNKTRIETYKKKKEMDVFSRANTTEKHLSERIIKEAKIADEAKKAELMKELMTLKMSKNDVPYFIDKTKVIPSQQKKS